MVRHPALVPDPIEYLRRATGYGNPLKIFALDDDARSLAKARLRARLAGGELGEAPGFEYEVASLLLALAGAASSKLALSRLVEAEVYDASRLLEEADVEDLIIVARGLGLRVERGSPVSIPWLVSRGRVYYRRLDLSAPFTDVLENAEVESVSSLFMLGGRVYLDRRLLILMITGTARRRLLELAGRVRELIPEGLEDLEEEAKSLAEGAREPRGLVEEALPSCIKAVLARARSGRGLSDEEVYLLSTFMARIGAGSRVLEEVLSKSGLVPPGLAPLVASILYEEASRFSPYNCRALEKLGLCRCRGSLLGEYASNLRRVRG